MALSRRYVLGELALGSGAFSALAACSEPDVAGTPNASLRANVTVQVMTEVTADEQPLFEAVIGLWQAAHPSGPTAQPLFLATSDSRPERLRAALAAGAPPDIAALEVGLPAQIGCLGRSVVEALDPWQRGGRAVAIDSTVLAARGGVWHRKDRERGVVPHSSIDTEAAWTKSGWHGWVYGWKLHLVSTAAAVWLPLAAELTPANVADNEAAPGLLDELPATAGFVLGDLHYGAPNVRAACARAGRVLVTPRRGPYPHADAGVDVRRVFHHLRSRSIENFNEQFKGIFACHGQVPTRGLRATRRFALGAVFVYQLAVLHRYQSGGDLRQGLRPFLCAA